MALRRRSLLARAALLPAAATLALPALRRAAAEPSARLGLLHINDFHAKHDGLQASGAACRDGRPCLGGSARLASGLDRLQAEAGAAGRPVLRLDAGDQFTGSLFHTAHQGATEAAVQRATRTQAMALGNHEFDGGPARLAAYAARVPFPLLSANLDASAEPLLAGLLRGHAVFTLGGARIGVIGLTTEITPEASSPGPTLRFTDAAAAAERSIAAIRAEGPATILLLSHLGLTADRALAARLPGVDVILGGHSHTLLADLPEAEGPSPDLVEGPDRVTRIVQAGAYGRWCGRLDLDLGPGGQVLAHGGRVLPVTPELPEDPGVAAIVADYRRPLEALRARPVATLAAPLPNAGCRQGECRLGSLVAEAMLAATPGAELALTNGGGLRAGLPAGAISLGDVLEVLPFNNSLAWLTLRGGDLRAALEIGLSRIEAFGGGFPQVAGMRLRYDPAAPPGQRLREVLTAASGGWQPLDDARAYRLVTNDFNRRGGDGYAPFRDRALAAYDNGAPLEEVLAGYLAAGGGASTALDGRIAAVAR